VKSIRVMLMSKIGLNEFERIIGEIKDAAVFDENISLINPHRTVVYWIINNDSRDIKFSKFIAQSLYNYRKYKNLSFKYNAPREGTVNGIFLAMLSDFKYIYDLEKMEITYEHEFNYNIKNILQKQHNIDILEILYYSFLPKRPKTILKVANSRRIPFETYITRKLTKSENNFYCNDTMIKNHLGLEAYNYLKYVGFRESIRWYLAWKKIFKIHKPNFFFLISEYGPFEYMGVVASKNENIPSIALQHGVICPTHSGYYHHPKNVAKKDGDNINYVLPDLTLVQGKYEKKLLLKWGYPKKAVLVTGQPRYDFLLHADEIFNKKQIIKKYNLPKNKKFLLWATQTHGLSKEENLRNIKAIFGAMNELKDRYHLIIKLHPLEDQNAPLYKRFLNKPFATIIRGRENTYELIHISDMVITKHSTVGIESIVMNKPIVLIETVKSARLNLYTDYGFRNIVQDKYDLIEYVKLLESGELLDAFEKRRRIFLRDRICCLGRATENVAKVLEKFL